MRKGHGHFQIGLFCAAALATGILDDTTANAQPGTEVWVRRYGRIVEAGDQAKAKKIATDPDGNVIVAGYNNSGLSQDDWLIIKYSNAGVALWTNRYNGLANDYDQPNALVVDGSGNIIVTGSSYGIGSDYVTIKYSGTGVPLWTNRYNGSGNGHGFPTAVAVDGSGNIIVTGYSYDNGNGSDYATVKYSGAGALLWEKHYNGLGNGSDFAHAVAVDSAGNVFVTGTSTGNNSGSDFTTLAYSAAGVWLWERTYNGSGNGADSATSAAVDRNGRVYVTGISTGIGSGFDYVTIAYSGAGMPLWTNRYDGPGNGDDYSEAVAVDGRGNVFVTGYSLGDGSDFDYATLAYSELGVPLWTNRYNGPGNSPDQAFALAVDASGDVLVTGYSPGDYTAEVYATIKYSGSGAPLWTNQINGSGNAYEPPPAVAVDGIGNVFVTGHALVGGNPSDFAVIANSSAGVPMWTNSYNGPANWYDNATAVAVDRIGNVFVTGTSVGDYSTIKYSGTGEPLWTNRYDGPTNGSDGANSLAVDADGNVIVTGHSYGVASGADYLTIKYSGAGMPIWTNRYDGPGNGSDSAGAVVLDGNGNVFVTGSVRGSDGIQIYATLKYSRDGVPIWTNYYGLPATKAHIATALAVDGQGNVVVTGFSYNTLGRDFATIAYSSAGIPLWTNRYNSAGNQSDSAVAVAVATNGNVFVTGYSGPDSPPFAFDYVTIAYSSTGAPLWTNRYNGPANGNDQATALATDCLGNVFVTGSSAGSNGSDYVTIAYSSAGLPLWTNRYDGPGHTNDAAQAVAVDSVGNVIVTGTSLGNETDSDFATVAYSAAGFPLWTNRYNGPVHGGESLTSQSLAVAPDGVIVAGSSDASFGPYTINDYAIVKYSTVLPLHITAVEKLGSDLRLSFYSQAGLHYNVQARANLAAGDWNNLVRYIPSGGAVTEVTLTNALVEPRQFYRIQQLP